LLGCKKKDYSKGRIALRAAAEAVSLYEIGGLELPPCTVADVEHQHRLPLFFDFIDDPVDVRLLAVEQVPQLPFGPSSFGSNGAAMGMQRQRMHSLLQPVVPARGSL
jgi:hypothetical protein